MADMQRIKRELKYAGAVVDVYADTMKFKNGNTEVWDTVLHKKGAAAVIPVLPDGRIILVRQYRNALDKEVLEIPAGCKDSPDEESIVCAARELEEETGYHSDCLENCLQFQQQLQYLERLLMCLLRLVSSTQKQS